MFMGICGDGRTIVSDAASIVAMAQKAKREVCKIPLSEQEKINMKREYDKEQIRINKFIQQGVCPYCGEKLVRGKKDKHNNYKRSWECVGCLKTLVR